LFFFGMASCNNFPSQLFSKVRANAARADVAQFLHDDAGHHMLLPERDTDAAQELEQL
jgi:hypothetical protein